jgi:hypothetical protein
MLVRVVALLLLLPGLLAGCATPTKMAYSDESRTVVKPSGAVFLMTATVKNNYHPSFQPRLLAVNVEKAGAKEKADRLNFIMDKQARLKEADSHEEGNSYLLRMELPPGQYVIRGLTSLSQHFPVSGAFFTPLHEELTVTQPGVFYLGHVDGTVRERTGSEFKAGPSIPLIDQAAAGASGGTFDVEVSDRWVVDEATFRSTFTQLGSASIQKAILRPFDRGLAQDWWEKH